MAHSRADRIRLAVAILAFSATSSWTAAQEVKPNGAEPIACDVLLDGGLILDGSGGELASGADGVTIDFNIDEAVAFMPLLEGL